MPPAGIFARRGCASARDYPDLLDASGYPECCGIPGWIFEQRG